MAWRVADPDGRLDHWGANKNSDERWRILAGLADLADSPLSILPGVRVEGRSQINRWTIIGGAVVVFRVYEAQDHIDIVNIYDLPPLSR